MLSVTEPAPSEALDAAALAARAMGGDRAAEARLCLRLSPAIRAFARRRLRSQDAAREFQQEVLLIFVEALRNGRVEEPARVAGFVLGICRNLALDRVRERERRGKLWELYGDSVSACEVVQPTEVTVEIMRLEDCLTELSQRARDAVWLSYGELLSHSEVSTRLGISEGNARVLRHRALHALKQCVALPKRWEASQ
ncbi:MAG TPA: sigma-70 family RNA polymerase sigma factor [Polyangiaceae bacterium]|nr:sigma-70 family RNA polymerase sigma factor [Polyangiaceae bacterium]